MGILMKALLQKPSSLEPDISKITHRQKATYHVPVLNDMSDYASWNDKLGKKMNYLHKIYKRFIKKYGIKEFEYTDTVSKDQEIKYSSDIDKHLLNYNSEDKKTRFVHYDMAAMEAETLSTVKLFEEMEGQNPFTTKIDNEIIALNEISKSQAIEVQHEITSENEQIQEEPKEIAEEDVEEVEEEIKEFDEIPIKNRADILLYLCLLKADSPEYSKFLKKASKEKQTGVVGLGGVTDKQSQKPSEAENKSESETEDDWCDTQPVLLGQEYSITEDSKTPSQTQYFYFDTHEDCRVYSQDSPTSEFKLVTNSTEELKMLISKLQEENSNIPKKQNKRRKKGSVSLIIFMCT
jgi:hypothetical protein